MITKCFSEKKAIIILISTLLIFFVFRLLIQEFSIIYFSNPNIERMLMHRMNQVFSDFIYALVFGLIYSLAIIVFINKVPLRIRGGFFIPYIFIFFNIKSGVFLICNTEHLFSPKISTFIWKDWVEYHNFLLGIRIYDNILSFIIIFSIGYFCIKKVKAMKQLAPKQNKDSL